MSVKLTTNLSQRLVLTPQLRQRIEMLQMTSIELSDLIQQQLLENPILEEVQQQDEKREIETEILDQLAGTPEDAPPSKPPRRTRPTATSSPPTAPASCRPRPSRLSRPTPRRPRPSRSSRASLPSATATPSRR
jgi:DNA-directed RNA polymerase specialized sigma54-like protein